MELANNRDIEALLTAHKRLALPTPRAAQSAAHQTVYQVPMARVRRCRCGECVTCRENARWERIYNEKFADPDYYKDRHGRHSSPLEG